ncbi:MAG: RHS repeat-associated core domain-containing protein [Planctomyces sp.]
MSQNGNGYCWDVASWPKVQASSWTGANIMFRNSGGKMEYMKTGITPGSFDALFGNQNVLTQNTSTGEFTLQMSDGSSMLFNSLSISWSGLMKTYTSPGGVQTTLTDNYATDLTYITKRSTGSGSTLLEETFVQQFNSSGILTSVVRTQKRGSAAAVNVDRVSCGYHTGTTAYGSSGDLAYSISEVWDGTAWVAPKTTFYTYFKTGESNGFEHGLKFAIGPAAYEQMVTAGYNPMTNYSINDSTFAQFADREVVQYETSSRRVLIWRTNAGTMSYQISYTGNTNSGLQPVYGQWYQKSVLTRPDGSKQVFYSNYYGLVILSVLISADGQRKWCSFNRYDSVGRIIWQASASAITGYDESKNDLLNETSPGVYQYLRNSEGLIQTMDYWSSGAEANYVKYRNVRKGQLGTDVRQSYTQYTTQSSGTGTGVFVSSQTVYRDDSATDAVATGLAYTFHSGTLQPSQITTTLPAVTVAQNGDNTTGQRIQAFDVYGNLEQSTDERSLVSRYSYDLLASALTQSIVDYGTGRQNLTSDFEVDNLGRTTQTLGPAHQAVIDGVAKTVRTASWTVYKDAISQTLSAGGFAEGTAPSYTFTLVNPVSITNVNKNGNVLEQIQATRASTSGKLQPSDTFAQSTYVRWTTNQYQQCCRLSSTRVYHLIPASGVGVEGTNYNTTSFGYDDMSRRNQVTSPGGTISFSVFDDRGLTTGLYVGTDDTGATQNDPTGGGAAGNNMVLVTSSQYDGGADGGDGNLTTSWSWLDSSTSRQTTFGYDFRNRQTSVSGPENSWSGSTYSNLNQLTEQVSRNGSAAAVLLSKNVTDYDNRGRVYRTTTWAVNPSTGALGNSLVSNTWYDQGGNVIKSLPAGSSLFSKTMYDILGRATSQYTGYDLDESTYAEALTVTDDTILEQSSSSYNEVGSVLSVTAKQRYHDAPASQTGALGTPTTSPKARVTYSASWYDGTGRATAAADYGTNGGAAFTRPSTPPASSDTILVSVTSFNSDGEVQSATDPAGMVTQLEYDAAGRRVTQIENYVSGGTQADQNRTTWTTYTPDGQVATLTASNSSTGNQQTTYTYGTTLSSSAIASSQLLRWVQYPDSSGSGGDYVTYSYNRQGQQTLVTDQGGCQHAFDYDGLGRQIHDRVLTLGTTAIGNARRISTVYDSRGLVSTISTWDDSRVGYGSVLNQVQNVYNDFGQQTHSYQSHAGSVDLMNTPKVQYSYASGSANTIRMTGMTYPDGRGLSVDYGTAGDINDASSRVQSLKFTAEAFSLADYQYLGASGFVNQASSQPGINWTLYGSSTDPDTGDIYSGLDRFGRIDNCLWQKGTTTLAQIQYGYDRASNRTWRQDGVLSGYDELYQYDGLQRLKDQKRGTLNSTHTAITSSTFQQQWGLDATGNWSSFKQDDDGSGSWDLVQSRSANKVNEITSISNSTGTAWNTPLYDPAGNMIGIPNGGATVTGTTPAWVPFTESQWTGFTEAQWNAFTEDTGTTPQQITAQYDAWNRLVKVITTPLNFVEHVYDGRGFRIGRRTTVSNTVTEDRHYYYTPGWQCLEERVGSVTTSERQFVWGLRYIDDLVIRDRSTANNGTINERRYAMQDGNWNTIAICDTTGSVGERYAYSAYGAPVFMTGAGTVQSSSTVGFETLYAGYRWDNPAPQMYYVRNRFLLPQVGTWNRRDPLRYVAGMNFNSYLQAVTLVATDPFALYEDVDRPVKFEEYVPYHINILQQQAKPFVLSETQIEWHKRQLLRGCVGITASSLGFTVDGAPYLGQCYATLPEALKAAERYKCPEGNVELFSVNYYLKKPLPSIGKDIIGQSLVDMESWWSMPREKQNPPGGNICFDFSYPWYHVPWDRPGNVWWCHADHCHNPDEDGDGVGDNFPSDTRRLSNDGRMTVKFRNRPVLWPDLSSTAYCLACREITLCRDFPSSSQRYPVPSLGIPFRRREWLQ